MKRTSRLLGVPTITAIAVAVGLSCGGNKKGPTTGPGPGDDRVLVQTGDAPPGLTMRLSDGTQGKPAADRSKLAPATKLGDADITALLARAKALAAEPDDRKDFALRQRSQPPPRTGKTINASFPGAAGPPPPAATADRNVDLTVLRWAPEGEVPLAPQLSLTFSQPMVAVTSHADTVAAGVPVKLTPQPKGQWRWVGTRTLLFDPDVRFPQATTYTVEVPAGTKAATGNVLKEATRFTFTTPAPRVQGQWPVAGPHRRDAAMFVSFDQRVDAAAVLDALEVRAGGKTFAVRALTADEIAKDEAIAGLVAGAKAAEHDQRWVAFRAVDQLPADTTVTITVGKGTPSAEGPNKTKEAQSWTFQTYAPLRIEEARCAYGDDCPPLTPWYIQFNNPLDADALDDAQFTVEPAVAGLKVDHQGSWVYLRGATKGRTTYKVTVSGGVLDDFGQTLGKDQQLIFKVGAATPNFYGPSGLIVLDPAAKAPTYDVFTINHAQLKVQLFKVEPTDWDRFGNFMRNQWNRKDPPKMPGKKVFDQLVKTGSKTDELTESHIDLMPALGKGGLGHVIAVVEPSPWKESHDPPRLYAWIQSTRIAVDAFVDDTELIAWSTRLADGAPVDGVRLELLPFATSATTDAKGLARLPLAAGGPAGAHILVARKGDDVAFVSDGEGWWNEYGSWTKRSATQNLAWYVIDDRKMYRPGEEVHLKGWMRRVDWGEGGDVAGLGGVVTSVKYTVTGPQGNALTTGTAKVSALGGFDTSFKLPTTPNLGYATIHFQAQGRMASDHHHSFQIQEFRRPEFEVSATASQGPHLVGAGADVTVNARYYAGGGLQGADVTWFVTAAETTYTPPNRDDFIFGVWKPWWGWRAWWDEGSFAPPKSWEHQGKTDAVGAHVLRLDFLSVNPATPMTVQAAATVMDVNRQAWASNANLIVHPAAHYVGLRTARPFVERGQAIELEAITVDLDGKAVVGRPIDVRAVRLDWEYEKGKYVTKEVDPQSCAPTSAATPVPCSFTTATGGTYQITANVVDDQGRANRTQLTVWVTGGDTPPKRDVEQEDILLVPSAKEYKDGDVAEIMVQAPFFPSEGIVSIRRSGIVSTERITLTGPTTTIKVPIRDAYVPNVIVQVDLVGAAPRVGDDGKPAPALPRRPAYAKGSVDLPVPPRTRTLKVTVDPREAKVAPGAATKLDVKVVDAAGRAVENAEVAVIVVDEAILSLTGYQFDDPVGTFYSHRWNNARDHHMRAGVKLATPDAGVLADGKFASADGDAMAETTTAGAPGGGMPVPAAPPMADASPVMARGMAKEGDRQQTNRTGQAGQAQTPIAVRTNFNPLATFAPEVRTDGAGKAVVDVKVPDNLTRYRIIAVAVAGEKQFGKGESAITARMPLMVRPSPPRFLNFGDTFQLPVVLQNQTDAPMTVQVAVRTTNVALTDGAGRQVTVPANDRVEVRFPAAAEMAGTARFQIVGAAGSWSDAAELALPVWTPATTEAFATYGVIDEGAIRQPVKLPGAVVPQFGGLEVETSSTQLQALTDAFLYLVTYPYECSEQLSSRILGVAALRDVLTEFEADGLPSPAAIEARVGKDLERLASMQNGDGGFPFWQRGYESWPYLSVHVGNALIRAKGKGYAVPADMLAQSLAYLKTIEQRYPSYYPPEVRRTITAYALYVRKLMGDADPVRARGLIKEAGGVDKLSMEAVGWLLGTMTGDAGSATERKAILRHLDNRVVETAAAANFTTAYADGGHLLLASDRRVDGIVLESLMAEQPTSDLIPKLVIGLLGHQKKGRWNNTQDNVFVLLALDDYFHRYEKVKPDFVARVWLGAGYAGDHAFKGRQTDRHVLDIPMKFVVDLKQGDLTIQKDGAGRLYYRIGMTYAPASLKLEPADHGFAVERRYESVDDAGDVQRLADGTWKIKAGARVRVKLTMVAENRRYHVALVDPLPAGLEPMNPALAVTGPVPADPAAVKDRGRYWWWSSTWYEHQNMRDERVEAFTSLLWEGVHEYSYVARATTPGTFVVPPTKAEEMYFPETFGRAGSDKVIVE